MNNSFLHTQERLYREAADLLALYIQQAAVMQQAERDGFEILAKKLDAQLTKISYDFEAITKKITPPVVKKIKYEGIIVHREDTVIIAESFDWYPHDHVN